MSIEADLYGRLRNLVSDRVYFDAAPYGTTLPYVTLSQVGGEAVGFLEQVAVSRKNARWQVNTWGATRSEVQVLARAIEDHLVAWTTWQVSAIGAPVGTFEPDLALYGTLQHFSVWFDDTASP